MLLATSLVFVIRYRNEFQLLLDMTKYSYDPAELRRTMYNHEIRAEIRDRITKYILQAAVVEAEAIAKDLMPDLDKSVAVIFILGQMQESLEAAIHVQVGIAANDGIPLKASTEALGYRGSSTTLRNRFPQIDEISELSSLVERRYCPHDAVVGQWTIVVKPLRDSWATAASTGSVPYVNRTAHTE